CLPETLAAVEEGFLDPTCSTRAAYVHEPTSFCRLPSPPYAASVDTHFSPARVSIFTIGAQQTSGRVYESKPDGSCGEGTPFAWPYAYAPVATVVSATTFPPLWRVQADVPERVRPIRYLPSEQAMASKTVAFYDTAFDTECGFVSASEAEELYC